MSLREVQTHRPLLGIRNGFLSESEGHVRTCLLPNSRRGRGECRRAAGSGADGTTARCTSMHVRESFGTQSADARKARSREDQVAGDRRARDTCASHKTMIDRPAYRQTDRLDSTHRLGLPATIGATLSPVSVTEGTAPASTAPSSFSARQTPPHVRSIRVWPRAFRRRHCRRW